MGKNCDVEVNQCLRMSCYNNATCIRVSAARYKCQCAEGYTGAQCEFLQTVNFDRVSYIAMPSTAGRRNYTIMFSIRTTVKDGMVLYQAKVSFFYLVFSDSMPELLNYFSQSLPPPP